MKTCLVTGAAGLIGSHLVRELAKGWAVHAIARRALPQATHLHPIVLDLAEGLDEARLPAKVDAVVHLAQSDHFREFPERATDVFEVNTASTLRLLDYARRAGAGTFVLASSGGIYGHGDQVFNEDVPPALRGDLGFYLGTKFCAEILSESYAAYMDVVVLRFFFVYGPGQKPAMLVPRLIRSVQQGAPITLQGQDGIRINPIHVDDAVAAIQRSLGLGSSQRINVAGPQALSMREIGTTIGQVVRCEPKFEVQAAEPRHLVADIGKMSRLLGAPAIDFATGVERMLAAAPIR